MKLLEIILPRIKENTVVSLLMEATVGRTKKEVIS